MALHPLSGFLVGIDDFLDGPNVYFAVCMHCRWRVRSRRQSVVDRRCVAHRCKEARVSEIG